ncbi:MAG: methyltransferase domain-containing protein [Oscillochloridaceae bacterium umkhey_bin13]
MPKPSKPSARASSGPPVRQIEVVVANGLEELARNELRRVSQGARLEPGPVAGALAMAWRGELRPLLSLRLATSVYLVRQFAVPRPKALLGDEHVRAVTELASTALRLHPAGSFRTLYVSAAGAETAVLTRLKQELATRLKLEVGSDDGDLLVRLRRSADGNAWDLLVRLSPRPLATRPWRVCNREGALNGPVAHAIALLTKPSPEDVYLNLGCGSGTLLVERLLIGSARRMIGCDLNQEALACAQTNLAAAGLDRRCELHAWDARALPLPDRCVGAITADLPFGHLVGSHTENLQLYPALLDAAARVARPGARCVLLSHEVRLLEGLLAEHVAWATEQVTRVDLGGLFPRIFVLRRRG